MQHGGRRPIRWRRLVSLTIFQPLIVSIPATPWTSSSRRDERAREEPPQMLRLFTPNVSFLGQPQKAPAQSRPGLSSRRRKYEIVYVTINTFRSVHQLPCLMRRGWSRTQIKHRVPKTSSSLVD